MGVESRGPHPVRLSLPALLRREMRIVEILRAISCQELRGRRTNLFSRFVYRMQADVVRPAV